MWSFYWIRCEVNVTVFEPRSEPLDGIELSSVGNALAKRWLLWEIEILLKNKRLGPSLEESTPCCVAVARVSCTPSLHALLARVWSVRESKPAWQPVCTQSWLWEEVWDGSGILAGKAAAQDRECWRREPGEGTCVPGPEVLLGKSLMWSMFLPAPEWHPWGQAPTFCKAHLLQPAQCPGSG